MPPSGDDFSTNLAETRHRVTLADTMDSGLTATLAGSPAQPDSRVEGDKVEEVEDPPIPTRDGNTSPSRITPGPPARLTRARPRAHVTS